MTDNLEYIDDYFRGELSAEELKHFDQRVSDDPVFAGDLAFYLSATNVIQNQANEDRKIRFRELYEQSKQQPVVRPVRTLTPYLSAAAVVASISLLIFLFYPASSPEKIADKYIKEHLTTLGVSMGGSQDAVQDALRLYNSGKFEEALIQFEILIKNQPSDHKLKEYAGIVSLRLTDYDKALKHFRELEALKGLYANPGKFYVALTLLKRNHTGDVAEAKMLLKQVTDQRLEHDAEARELLNRL